MANLSKPRLIAGTGILSMVAVLSLSPIGLDDIKQNEGLRTTQYYDEARVATICYGSTNTGLKKATVEQCNDLLKRHTDDADRVLKKYIKVKLTQEQYDALHDFIHQYGEGKFRTSTLLKRINAGDCKGAVDQFPRWRLVNGTFNKGVYNRSLRNAAKFSTGCKYWE
jgi:lysozyme